MRAIGDAYAHDTVQSAVPHLCCMAYNHGKHCSKNQQQCDHEHYWSALTHTGTDLQQLANTEQYGIDTQ
eukprot:6979402-Alexandrium_andersonii.AAC.1